MLLRDLLFEAKANEIQLVILDVVMPGLSGPDAYTQMSAIKPGLPVIFTTGYTTEMVRLNYKIEEGASFLQKPYSRQALAQAVRNSLNRHSTGKQRGT